jgi:hypothetical protein
MMEVSVKEEIAQIQMERPHVVILGAGASYAAFPGGDKHGRKLPLMNNFIEVLGLDNLLSESGIEFKSDNFEDIYDQLYKSEEHKNLKIKLEEIVYDYFKQMEIGDDPTIYDHLLLSLRKKDVVATFNWDPFLTQAYRRNANKFSLPRLLFLHGNVEVGYCEKDNVVGLNGNKCSHCGQAFKPTKLLYPVSEKNYHLDGFISLQWEELHQHLTNAFMMSIFGYSAPKSDVSAIELMKSAWGNVAERSMEQIEIIDIKSDDDLRETWKEFIHTHHYETHSSFHDSWIANHPRRTGEAYINQYWEAQFINNNPIPKDLPFPQLWEWYRPLRKIEKQKEEYA